MKILIYNYYIMGCCRNDKILNELIQNQYSIIDKLTKYNKSLLDEINDLKTKLEENKIKIEYQQKILNEKFTIK